MTGPEQAREFWRSLPSDLRWQVGDDLVLGTWDWRDWFEDSPPRPGFLRELDYQRLLWEQGGARP